MKYIGIGKITVHKGEPPNGNPYRGDSVMGEERSAALGAFLKGDTPEGYTFWLTPAEGGAARLTVPPPVDPVVIEFYWPDRGGRAP